MTNIISNLKQVLSLLTLTDYVFLGLIIFLIIMLVTILFVYRNSDETLAWANEKPTNDAADIMEIAAALEKCNEQLNIDLTPYESREEEASIISYDELVNSYQNKSINYIDESNEDLVIKKIDLENTITAPKKEDSIIKPLTLSYEKEEALLNALKQLQENLSGL